MGVPARGGHRHCSDSHVRLCYDSVSSRITSLTKSLRHNSGKSIKLVRMPIIEQHEKGWDVVMLTPKDKLVLRHRSKSTVLGKKRVNKSSSRSIHEE
jgi:hypothetical protein